MKLNRRTFLKTSISLSAAGLALLESQPAAAEWSATDFAPVAFDQTLKQITKGKPVVETAKINLEIPEIAENGALVPVTVTSSLTDIKTISLIAEQNPVPLALQLNISPGIEPFLSARLKLASSSFVFAIAEADTVCYIVKKKVKVTIGGCGG